MTPRERRIWLQSLAPTEAEQYTIICDLIRHKRGDEMSPEDLRICTAERDRLRKKGVLRA